MVVSLFFACALLSVLASLLGFLALGDLVQLVVSFPRSFTYRIFRVRWPLMLGGLAAFGASVGLWIAYRPVHGAVLAVYAVLFSLLFFSGFLAPGYVMFRTQQRSARYVPVAEVSGELPDDAEVLALEIDGDARAYPHLWILRPHVAGDRVGGDDVVMTYCGLSHLGMAFRNELGGRPLDLKVMTQLENNLILFDTRTGEPIEQIYGRSIARGPLEPIASTVMPFSSFRALYPQGKVFWNPTSGFLDGKVRAMMCHLLYAEGKHFDPRSPGPVFPTIEHFDPRIPPKELVYGVALGGEAVAFTRGYLERNGGVAVETLGGRTITCKHFPDYGFVDVFAGDVPDVDPRGLRGGIRQPRVPHASQVLWMIWANFYRETAART